MRKFLSGRVASLKYALKGAWILLTTEHAIMAQCMAFTIVIAMGLIFEISRQEWMMQTLAMGLVLGLESLNTAIEKTADFVHPEYHAKIGFIKDIAAGAVTFAVLSACVVFAIIYFPRF